MYQHLCECQLSSELCFCGCEWLCEVFEPLVYEFGSVFLCALERITAKNGTSDYQNSQPCSRKNLTLSRCLCQRLGCLLRQQRDLDRRVQGTKSYT